MLRFVKENHEHQYPGGLRTIAKFGPLMGEKPHIIHNMGEMYPDLTLENIIGTTNSIFSGKTKSDTYKQVKSKQLGWSVKIRQVKKTYFTGTDTVQASATSNRQPFEVTFESLYFNPDEVIDLQNGQKLFIRSEGRPVAEGYRFTVVLDTPDREEELDTRYISGSTFYAMYSYNKHAEISERGYTRKHGQRQSFRQYMTTIRHSQDMSMDYAFKEKHYIEDTNKKDQNGFTPVMEINGLEKEVIDNYKWSRENANLTGVANYDVNGVCLDKDEKGQDIPSGDGIMRQCMNYARYANYAQGGFDTDFLDDLITEIGKRSGEAKGNKYLFVANSQFDKHYQKAIKNNLQFISNSGAYYFSRDAKNNVNVGANFNEYHYAGNDICISVNKFLDLLYPDQGYAICLNPKPLSNGEPTLQKFFFGNRELTDGWLEGMGGRNGGGTGLRISTSTTVSSYHLIGTAGIVYHLPSLAIIVKESVI